MPAPFSRREVTRDGLERTFALNHMAYFVLTAALRDRLIAAAPARIIVTASNAHRKGRLDLDDLQSERNYSAPVVYGPSSAISCLPASWRTGSRPTASRQTASAPVSWRPASAMKLAAWQRLRCAPASCLQKRLRKGRAPSSI